MKTRNTEHRLLKSVTSIVKKILVKYLKGKNKINKSVYSIDVYQINENKKKNLKGKKKSKECSNFSEDKWMGEKTFMRKSCWQVGTILEYHMQVLDANM